MNLQFKSSICKLLLLASLPLVFAGCGSSGGGGGVQTPTATSTISGDATKGPISGARVSAYLVAANGEKGAQLGKTVISGADGKYSLDIPATSGPVLIEIVGQPGATYLSETTGKPVPFGASESFRAITTSASTNLSVTLSPFTEAGYQKMLQLLTASPAKGISDAIENGNKAVADMHKIGNLLAPPDENYLAALAIADKIIQSTPSGTTTTLNTLLRNAVTATTTEQLAAYTTAVAAAAQTLSSTPGVAAVTDAIKQTPPPVTPPVTPPVIPPVTPPVTPPATPPTTPAIGATSSTTSTVTVAWSASTSSASGSLTYYLYRDGTFIASMQALTYTDSGLLPATPYKYEVKASDSAGTFSAFSAAVTVTTQAAAVIPPPAPVVTTAPTAPTNLQVTSLTSTSVTITWGASTGTIAITGYDVYRNGVKVATVAATSYTDATLVAGTSYSFQVKGINANAISSAFSPTVTVTPQSNPAIPGTITITTGGTVTTQ